MIQHDLLLVYISGLLQRILSTASPLQGYYLPTHGNGEVPVIGKLPYGTNWVGFTSRVQSNLTAYTLAVCSANSPESGVCSSAGAHALL
jgi:hypothetical protein